MWSTARNTIAAGARLGRPLVDLALAGVVRGEREHLPAVVLLQQVAQVPGAVGDVHLRRGEVALHERGAARLLGDVVGGLGHQLHQTLRAGARGLVAEVRLGVDDARDQRGVEALVRRLLADDVVVAQGQLDLLHRPVGPRRDGGGHDQRRGGDGAQEAEPAAQCAPARRPRASGPRSAGAICGWRCRCSSWSSAQLLKNRGEFLLERREIPVVADDVIGARRLLVLGELAGAPLVDARRDRGPRRAPHESASSATTTSVAS